LRDKSRRLANPHYANVNTDVGANNGPRPDGNGGTGWAGPPCGSNPATNINRSEITDNNGQVEAGIFLNLRLLLTAIGLR